jgi:hypothetical protein
MKDKILKFGLVAIAVLVPLLSHAESAQANRENLIVTMFSITQMIAFVVGLYLSISFLLTLKRHADAPNDQSASISKMLLILMTAAFLLNLNLAINMLTQTITGTESYCFTLNAEMSETKSQTSCFDPNSSEITEELRSRIDPATTSTQDLMNYLSLIMGLVQFLGLVFFIKAILMIKQIGGGNGEVGPGKVIIALIFSALIIDLPHTLEMLSDTIKSLGVAI